ncbi:MAG TPA: hypothetical protein VJS68_00315 [Thermoplasmata archaeon]|nr:hypothetical protein [Thermoplasmata archaeon]
MGRIPLRALGIVVAIVVAALPSVVGFSGGTAGATSVTPEAGTGQVQGYLNPASGILLWDGAPISVASTGFFAASGTAGVAHNLTGNASGYYNKTVFVTLAAGTTSWQNLTLRIGNGSLSLFVSPYDSSLTVSGRSVALSNVGQVTLSLLPGTYSLSISHPLYRTDNRNVTINPFGILGLVITLQPLTNRGGGGGGGGLTPPLGASAADQALLIGGIIALAVVVCGILYYDHIRRSRGPEVSERLTRRERREEARQKRVRRIPRKGPRDEGHRLPED